MKKIVAILLSLAILFSVLAGCGKQENPTSNATEYVGYTYLFRDLPEAKYITAASDFAGGDGTESNPYLIANADQLAYFGQYVTEGNETKDKFFKLTSDAENGTVYFLAMQEAGTDGTLSNNYKKGILITLVFDYTLQLKHKVAADAIAIIGCGIITRQVNTEIILINNHSFFSIDRILVPCFGHSYRCDQNQNQ